ncbi:MAG: hypothetical protein GY812_11465 [Actinomycetia bacterium]|nr:hypothetical protein [Actinomycetes bacterium]
MASVAQPSGVSAQEGGAAPTTTATTLVDPPPSTTSTTQPPGTTTTTTTTAPGGGSPEDPGDGFTIPEAPERETPPEDPAPPDRPSRDELIPPPIDLTSLNQVVETRRAEATAGARLLADAANADAAAKVAASQATLDSEAALVPAADELVESARAAERSAVTALERARDRTGDLAIESYKLAVAGREVTMNATADAIVSMDGYDDFVKTSQYSGAAWTALTNAVSEAEVALVAAESATADALEERTRLERRITEARFALERATAEAVEVAEMGEQLIAEAAKIGEDLAFEGLGPTILGETILGPEDLAGFSQRRPGAPPYDKLLELAGFFVEEGESEGVRGDIAWAQSILETGNFGYRGSMVSTSDNNYAGIGACDSCSSGFRYKSPRLGVRAQMQLLRAYADDNLTTDQLGNPPVGRAPERVGVRGCCDTWMELSGVWATGPGYGVKILTLYNEMLSFAAARQRSEAALGAAGGQ